MEDEDEVRSMEEGMFADEAEVSGSEGERSDRNDKNSGDEDKDKDDKDKKKKVVKKTGPVKRMLLHEEMLCGPNGLIKLEDNFKDFKLRGKGYEKEDLDRILHKLEHWVHNLHPKHPFGQTLERIEFLGLRKKILRTHVKKIRMGLVSNFDHMDEDNLPDLVDSDVEEMPEREEHQHREIRIGAGTLESEIPTIDDDDDDDDEFMAMIDRVTKNAESAVAADPEEEFPDNSDFVVQNQNDNGNVSEDEELLNLHHKLGDSDEEDNIFQSFTRNEQTTLSIQTPGGRNSELNLHINDQTTMCIPTTPATRTDSQNSNSDSNVRTNDQTTLMIQTPGVGVRTDSRNSDTDFGVNDQVTLPVTDRAISRNSDPDLRTNEPTTDSRNSESDLGANELTLVPVPLPDQITTQPRDLDSDSDADMCDLDKTEVCPVSLSEAPQNCENVKVLPLPEDMDESDL